MATSYTSKIEQGVSFEEFAMGCARAFCPCIEMRDAPADAEIPQEFKPSGYYLREIKLSARVLSKWQSMSEACATQKAAVAYLKECRLAQKELERVRILCKTYAVMLERAGKYRPPTKDHVEFKKFMIDQLIRSIKFDCDTKYYEDKIKNARKLSGVEYKKIMIDVAMDDLRHYKRKYQEEVMNCKKSTKWVKQLRKSLRGRLGYEKGN
jgi:hypothetical protein